jgi:cell division protein ZapA
MSTRPTGTGERMATLDVSLLGRDYKVACREGEQAALKDAVAFLETRMREIRDGSKSSSVERIAVMAALNLAHDFQRERAAPPAAPVERVAPPAAPVAAEVIDVPALRRRIAGMQSAIDQVLPGTDKLL